MDSIKRLIKSASKKPPVSGVSNYYNQQGIKTTQRNTTGQTSEVEMSNMGEETVEVDLDALRNRNMMRGEEVNMPTEVPEDSGATAEDGLLTPEQDGRLPEGDTADNVETDDLLGLNEEQTEELEDLLNEDGSIDLFEDGATNATENFSTKLSNAFKNFFKSNEYEGIGEVEEGGIEMGEIGAETTAETGAEVGAETAVETATELGTEVAIESGTELAVEGGALAVGEAVTGATAYLGPVALVIGGAVATGFVIAKTVEADEKQKKQQAEIDLKNRKIEDMRGYLKNIQNTKSRKDRRVALDDLYSSDKGMTNIKGVYVATAPIYKTLKNYTEKTNIYIDHVNTVSDSYKKWVLNSNDPDGYTNGNSMYSKYKPMPLMSAGEIINTVTSRNETIDHRIHDYVNKYYKAGEPGEYDGYLKDLMMRDNDMIDHYRQQSQEDEGYIQARTDYFIEYNIKKRNGTLKNDLGEIPSPEYLEETQPPFWEKYYIQHQKRFMANDERQIFESKLAYVKRGKKPIWQYKKPVVSERERRAFQSAFEKRNGHIKVMRIKEPEDDAPTQMPKNRPRGRDFRPVEKQPVEKQKSIPSKPVEYGHEDSTYKNGKEWDLDERQHTFSPHNAIHYLMLASLTYDIGPIYNSFEEVPAEFELDKYTVKQYLGRQKGNFFQEMRLPVQTTDIFGNLEYNAFGLMFYDEKEDRIVIAIEGTDAPSIDFGNVYKFLQDVQTDLKATFETYNGDRFHTGMLNYALQLKDDMFEFINNHSNKTAGAKPTEVVFTGHSLGGMSSQILMYLASIHFNRNDFVNYSFASPRGFSETMITKVEQNCPFIFRVLLEHDVVPYLPPRIDDSYVEEFIHAGQGFIFSLDGGLVETMGDTLGIPRSVSMSGNLPFLFNIILGGIKNASNISIDAHSRMTIKKAIETYYVKHDTIGHSITPVNKLIEKYNTLRSEDSIFTKHDDKMWKKQGSDDFYFPTYHRGQIGFQYIPSKAILGIYMYNENEFQNSGDIKGFVLF